MIFVKVAKESIMDISNTSIQSLQQRQKLSQSQINSLNILAMNNFELKEFLQAEQLENPLLEIHETNPEEDLLTLGSWFSNNESPFSSRVDDEQESLPDIPDRTGLSLYGYLKDQINYNKLTQHEIKLLCYIIDLLDADTGFLKTPVKGNILPYRRKYRFYCEMCEAFAVYGTCRHRCGKPKAMSNDSG